MKELGLRSRRYCPFLLRVPGGRVGPPTCRLPSGRVRSLSPHDLRAFCEGRIAHFKIPRYVHLASEFPMTVTGKIQKYKMREESIELLGLQSAAGIRTA